MKRRAVIIGINDYEKDDFTNLRYCVSDAQKVCDFLESLPGEERFECRCLENPTDAEVVDAIEEALEGLQPGDLFLLYFSGHGFVRGEEDYLLLCKNARWSALTSGATNGTILCTHLAKMINKSSADALLCFDSCRSALRAGGRDGVEAMQGGKVLSNLFARDINPSAHRGRIWEIHSCGDGQRAFEKNKGKGKGYGVFTHAFLECLKLRKQSGQAGVIDQEFIAAVAEITSQESEDNQEPQLTAPEGAALSLFDAGEAMTTKKTSSARIVAVIVMAIILVAFAINQSKIKRSTPPPTPPQPQITNNPSDNPVIVEPEPTPNNSNLQNQIQQQQPIQQQQKQY